MKKTVYVAFAVLLGLAMILLPTWLFLVSANHEEKLAQALERLARAEDLKPPLLGYSEQNHFETVSSEDVEILGISFVLALVVYVLFKRRTPRQDYVFPPFRPY